MRKKQLLFIMNSLVTGGAEISLGNLLNALDFGVFDVTLILLSCRDELSGRIDRRVKIQCIDPGGRNVIRRLLGLCYRKCGWRFPERLYVRWKMRGHYDAVVSYMEGAPLKYHSYIVDRGKKNITWVHSDLSLHGCDERMFSLAHQREAYESMSDVVFVSATVRDRFAIFFGLSGAFHVAYNIVGAAADMQAQAPANNAVLTVVSVGRLVDVKAFDRVVRVAALAKAASCPVLFQLVGDGPLRHDLEQLSRDLDVADCVQFLGQVMPPYGVMAKADVVLVTSRVEGFPMVVMEAFALGRPVVATRFAAAQEVLGDGAFGMLTEHDDQSIYHAIKHFLDDPVALVEYRNKALRGHTFFMQTSAADQLKKIVGNCH